VFTVSVIGSVWILLNTIYWKTMFEGSVWSGTQPLPLFCQNNLVCPVTDQVSISKIRFSNSLSSSFLFLFMFFEDEAFCVSTGYSSLRCPFSPICRRKRQEAVLSQPIRIKQYGNLARQHGLLTVLHFAWLTFEEVLPFNHWLLLWTGFPQV